MAIFLIPVAWWAVGAIGTAVGVGATLAVANVADDFGEAAEKTSKLVNNVSKAALLVGTAYVVYQNRETIMKVLSK